MKDLRNDANINTERRRVEIKLILIMILLGFLVQIAASFVLTLVLGMMPKVAADYMSGLESLLQITPAMIVRVCVIFPVLEEIFFRGIVIGIMYRFAPFAVANVCQALVFAIYHGNIVQGVYAFLLGLFIGYVLKLTRNIVYVFVLHMSINLLGMFIDTIIPMDTPMLLKSVIAAVSFVGIALIVKAIIRRNKVCQEC